MTNFLFDKSQNPHITAKQISDWFDLGSSTVQGKSKTIREMFKINPMDYKWCLPSRIDKHPVAWMISVNGYIIDVREAPYELQVEAYEAGVIPYIPDNKKS